MANKSKKNMVEQIYNWNDGLLHSKLAYKIDQGETLAQLTDYIIEATDGKLKPSTSTVNNYKAKYLEASKNQRDMGELLDLRRKTGDNILELQGKEHVSKAVQDDDFGNSSIYMPKKDKLTSTLEVLENIISLGNATLQEINAVDANILLKAISEHTKITGASNGGLMLSGLQQVALQQKAYESAMAEVIAKYVPEDIQEDLFAELSLAEQEFYDNLDLTKEGRAAKEALDRIGISIS